jgi:hypothetical protein
VPVQSPTLMNAEQAAGALKKALDGKGTTFTIADASAKSGLPLRDAESGMHALLSEYRGHLRVTSEGELVFVFPHGFTKPWETRTRIQALADKTGRALLGVGRFVVRAWISVVLIGYALLFLALILGLTFARSSSDRDDRGGLGFGVIYVLFRVVAEALFWTFHPFSPFAYSYYDSQPAYPSRAQRRRDANEPRFYDKVNRFFFGPDVPEPDPREMEKRVLAEIRAQKGRIGLADVIRVTGLPRDEADPMMSRLMLDYDGTVEVSEEGGIVYRFEALRKTVEQAPPGAPAPARPEPIWSRMKSLVPLTGNGAGTNILIVALNGFNLIMSLYALNLGLTIDRISLLLRGIPFHKLPPTDTPIALGVVPLVFSIALLALPLLRAAYRPFKERRIARENGRRGMLRDILTKLRGGEITDESLKRAWEEAAGREVDPKEITREVAALGGDLEIEEDGRTRYRFPDFETEAKALEAEREVASEEEARVGKVIFSSES